MNHAEARRGIRLLRAVNRYRENVALELQLAQLAREHGTTLDDERERVTGATPLGDPRALRGIPAIGYGVSGAISGTRPDQAGA